MGDAQGNIFEIMDPRAANPNEILHGIEWYSPVYRRSRSVRRTHSCPQRKHRRCMLVGMLMCDTAYQHDLGLDFELAGMSDYFYQRSRTGMSRRAVCQAAGVAAFFCFGAPGQQPRPNYPLINSQVVTVKGQFQAAHPVPMMPTPDGIKAGIAPSATAISVQVPDGCMTTFTLKPGQRD